MLARSAERTVVSGAVCLLLVTQAAVVAAQGARRPTRVLLIFQQQAETPPMLDFTRRLRETVRDRVPTRVEFYQEALDLDRFASPEHSLALASYFTNKYRGFTVDVIVPVGSRALAFTTDRLSETFPGVPIVFALGGAPDVDTSSLPARVTGRLASAMRFTPTLELARALQPEAEGVVVIGGAGRSDSVSVAAALEAIAARHDTMNVELLRGLSLDVLLRKVRQLPRRSIVIFANFRQGGDGQIFEPGDIIGSIARASTAPVYAQMLNYVGDGVVGGSVASFENEGAGTGRLIARVLRRRPGEPMPPVEVIPDSFVADWRQLQRWSLPPARLPSGARLLFRELTLWERYRATVLLTLVVIAAESLLIGGLLVERRRRKRAQEIAEEQRRRAEETGRQIAHMGRVILVGELAATISHELRQPLAAIRANAEAGAILLANPSRAPAEAREIFQHIVDDDARAVDVIESVRKLLRKDGPDVKTIDLNQICRNAVRLLEYDAINRSTRLELALASTPLFVTGDAVQLQQVVLNLALNGLEAAATSEKERAVIVSTALCADHAELKVRDSGPGIAAGAQSHLFEPFYTTKSGGLGMGLVIVRSIVERHNGRVSVESDSLGGTVSCIRLPRVPAPASNDGDMRHAHVPEGIAAVSKPRRPQVAN